MDSYILKVKDENGNWINIPAIKGDKGDGIPDGGENGQIIVKTSDGTAWQDNINAYTKQETDTLLSVKVPTSRTINGQDLSQDITIDTLPSQTGQDGKFLTTDGTNPSWQEIQTDGANTDLSNLSQEGQSKFDAKVDVDSLVEINPMIESYINGTEGYNIWANGYCEQWGLSDANSNGVSVTLLKTYKDTNYIITGMNGRTTTNDDYTAGYSARLVTTSSFTLKVKGYGGSGTSYDCSWKTSGYLADGEY